jgi:putative salt-induced outer membrane protein YdiY
MKFLRCLATALAVWTILCTIVYTEETPATTDTLVQKNGDRITGSIEKFDEGMVFIKNTNLGEVKIPWASVQFVQSSRMLYFRMENGNILAAQPQGMEDNKQVLLSPITGKVLVPRETILMVGTSEEGINPEYLRTKKELTDTKEALRKATTVSELWSGFIDVSFSGNEGNKNDRTFIATGHVERKSDADLFTAHIDIQYASARRERTKNQADGYLKEALDITSLFYVFGQLSGTWDEINDIVLRFRAEIGLGLHLLKEKEFQMFEGDKITLDWEVGGHFTNTDYRDQEDAHSGGVVTRVLYRQIFPNEWKLEITGEYYQSFQKPPNSGNNMANYTLKGKISLIIPISEVLSFSGNIWDEYNNYTSPGVKRNDFYWTFGLRVTL